MRFISIYLNVSQDYFSVNLHRVRFLIFFIGLLSCAIFIYGMNHAEAKDCSKYQCKTPTIADPNLKLEMVYQENDSQISYKSTNQMKSTYYHRLQRWHS